MPFEILEQMLIGLQTRSFEMVVGTLLGTGLYLLRYSVDSLSKIPKRVRIQIARTPPDIMPEGSRLTRLGRPIVEVRVSQKPLNALHLLEQIRAA